MKSKRQEIIGYVILKFINSGYSKMDVDIIASDLAMNSKQLAQYYPDFETLLFDVLSVITTAYTRKVFYGMHAENKNLTRVEHQAFYEIVSHRLYVFFTSDVGKAFICIYQQFEFDARFERFLTAIKTEWSEMLRIFFESVGVKYDAYDAFNYFFNLACKTHKQHLQAYRTIH